MEDRVASIVFFILAILVMIESLNLSFGDIHNPGPGFIPFFLGFFMGLLSFLSFLSPDMQIPGDAFWNGWQNGKNMIYLFAGLIIYLLLFKILGFCIDTFLLLVFLMKVAGAQGYKGSLLISIITMVAIYVVFYKILIIPFPEGILGF